MEQMKHDSSTIAWNNLGEEWFELINSCADYGQELNLDMFLLSAEEWDDEAEDL